MHRRVPFVLASVLSLLLSASAAALASSPGAGHSTSPVAPQTLHVGTRFKGTQDSSQTPGEATGAIGTTRFIEAVDSRVEIFTRAGASIASDLLANLFHDTNLVQQDFDPQIIWDGQMNRFIYAGVIIASGSNLLAFGFSKTASPSNLTSDFCHYGTSFSSDFPDSPRLGDTRDFILIGFNDLSSTGSYQESGVSWSAKPPAGPTCPPGTSFTRGLTFLKSQTGLDVFTPVPAQQTDTSGMGWIVSTMEPGTGSASTLVIHKVTKNSDGTANIPSNGVDIAVAPYRVAPPAAQAGASQMIDTFDTRLTQAVSARDPAHGGTVHLWTQHTVKSGIGSVVRWYELNPVAASVTQTGTIAFANGFAFNGAISPDRQVVGATHRYGGDMVITYNTSSITTHTRIMVRSKRGTAPISAPVQIAASPGPYFDFACPNPGDICPWAGAAATPDPLVGGSPTVGRVWITNTPTPTAVAPCLPLGAVGTQRWCPDGRMGRGARHRYVPLPCDAEHQRRERQLSRLVNLRGSGVVPRCSLTQ